MNKTGSFGCRSIKAFAVAIGHFRNQTAFIGFVSEMFDLLQMEPPPERIKSLILADFNFRLFIAGRFCVDEYVIKVVRK